MYLLVDSVSVDLLLFEWTGLYKYNYCPLLKPQCYVDIFSIILIVNCHYYSKAAKFCTETVK